MAQAARKAELNTIIQKGGIIYSHQARSKVTTRKETKIEKASRALEWVNTKESRTHNALRNKKIKCFKAAATRVK